MKRLLSIAAVCLVAATALVLMQCDTIAGGAPTNVNLTMATDSTVRVGWTAPTEGTPDKYYVAFMATGTSAYVDFDTVTTTTVDHDPAGKTGKYMVTAVFGSETFDAANTPTSEPIHSAATALSELNATGNSGYGWDRTAGTGSTYSMKEASNAANVDFYITDWSTGFSGPEYSVASPDEAPNDPGAVAPTGSWRINSYTNLLANEQAALPTHSSAAYFNFTDLTTDPALVGCFTTADGYYAIVKFSGYNTGAGTVQVETWLQHIKGLRLIQH